jgi:zinc transporter, ZIP family
VLGAIVLDRADAWVPHVHVLITGRVRADEARDATDKSHGVEPRRIASVILFIVAITLHNMPEGLAVGVGFGSGNLGNAIPLMLAIGIQNIPEGLAVSVAAVNAGLGSLFYAAVTGIRAGLVEIPLALFGAWAVQLAEPLLPYAMGFAAGAMIYVISDEIIPETHTKGHERVATVGTVLGVIVMLYLDVSLA